MQSEPSGTAPIAPAPDREEGCPSVDKHGGIEGGVQNDALPFRPTDSTTTAFETFYTDHRDLIGRALCYSLNDRDLGFEAADEAMVRAYRQWSTVSTLANPEGWVFKVGLNWGRSWIKRRLTAALKAPLLASPGPSSTPMEQLATDTDLAAAIAGLQHSHRAVVVLRYQMDYSVAQIAEALGVPEGTVKSRLSRAMKHLANDLHMGESGEQL